jgi:hypothetical protein
MSGKNSREIEQGLLRAVRRFAERVAVEAPFAEKNVSAARERLEDLVRAGGPVAEKDSVVCALLGMYGGMGSVNDFPWSPKGERAKQVLYDALIDARRSYFSQAGGESHDPASFALLEIGTCVRLIQGSTFHIDSRGRMFIVESREFPPEEVWDIRAQFPPDITGMPTYSLSCGNRQVVARHEALQQVEGRETRKSRAAATPFPLPRLRGRGKTRSTPQSGTKQPRVTGQ